MERRKHGHCARCKRSRNPTAIRNGHLRIKFGIGHDDYIALLNSQNGGCAICGASDPADNHSNYLSIDHVHGTNRIRGLLCPSCNKGLGFFADNSSRLRAAAKYIDDHFQLEEMT